MSVVSRPLLRPALGAVLIGAALFSAPGCARRPLPPQVTGEQMFSQSPRAVYGAALRVALADGYEVVHSDAAGGVLRLKRLHRRRGNHTDHLTLLIQERSDGAQVQVQTFATDLPTETTPGESPRREDGRPRAVAFLRRLAEAF